MKLLNVIERKYLENFKRKKKLGPKLKKKKKKKKVNNQNAVCFTNIEVEEKNAKLFFLFVGDLWLLWKNISY